MVWQSVQDKYIFLGAGDCLSAAGQACSAMPIDLIRYLFGLGI